MTMHSVQMATSSTDPSPRKVLISSSGAKQACTSQEWSEFTPEEIDRFPALKKRNFWCIQRHQATGGCCARACSSRGASVTLTLTCTAHHYDLRMQLDGGTFSWAIPKGLIGLNKADEAAHVAIETTVHPIGYTLYEGEPVVESC